MTFLPFKRGFVHETDVDLVTALDSTLSRLYMIGMNGANLGGKGIWTGERRMLRECFGYRLPGVCAVFVDGLGEDETFDGGEGRVLAVHVACSHRQRRRWQRAQADQ